MKTESKHSYRRGICTFLYRGTVKKVIKEFKEGWQISGSQAKKRRIEESRIYQSAVWDASGALCCTGNVHSVELIKGDRER